MNQPLNHTRGVGLPMKGNRFLRWTYARWVQILAHGDLLGADGKPSQGKLAAATAMAYGILTRDSVVVVLALAAGFGRGTLLAAIASWRGVSMQTRTISTQAVSVDERRQSLEYEISR